MAKPFIISKHRVVEAFRFVKANAGSAGVDKQSIAAFEESPKDNLYNLWNRMSSGINATTRQGGADPEENRWRASAGGSDGQRPDSPNGGQT